MTVLRVLPKTKSQELFSTLEKKSADFMRVCSFGVPLLKCTWQLSQGSNSNKKGPAKLQTLSPHPWKIVTAFVILLVQLRNHTIRSLRKCVILPVFANKYVPGQHFGLWS